MREAGIVCQPEVARLFHQFIDPQVLMQQGSTPRIQPDLMATVGLPAVQHERRRRMGRALPARRLLFDVKTAFAGHGDYLTTRAREDQAGAVAHRAAAVQTEYRAHARRLDAEHSPQGATPICDALETYTPVRALVFGSYAEASLDVHALVEAVARERARRQWRRMGARSEAEAYGGIVAGLRRYVGVVVSREFARHRIHRLPLVGVPRGVIDERRQRLQGGRAGLAVDREHVLFEARDFHAYQAHRAVDPGAAGT